MARAAWFFPVPDEAGLAERLQGLFAQGTRDRRLRPQRVPGLQYRPERLSAWFGHYKLLHVATEQLDEAGREMIAVVVSAGNACDRVEVRLHQPDGARDGSAAQ